MGRWKLDPSKPGGSYYDANDTGPDQVAPPAGWTPPVNAAPTQTQAPATPSTPSPSFAGTIPEPPRTQTANDNPFTDPGYANPGGAVTQGPPVPPAEPTLADFERDYHAPDREAVLARLRGQTAATSAPTSYAAMEGVDVNKLNDPTHQTPKYIASRILASGGSVADAAAAVGGRQLDAERFMMPDGEIIDTRRDATGANGQPGANVLQFLSLGYGDQAAPPTGATPTATPNGLAAASSRPSGAAAPAGMGGTQNDAFQSMMRLLLMDRLQALGQPVNPNDPSIRDPYNAARTAATRQLDAERKQLAERLYAEGGLNSDELTQGIQQSHERVATQLGTLRGQMVQQEMANRRQDLLSALQLAIASGDSQAARDLQAQIAMLDATLRREGYGVNLAIAGQGFNQAAIQNAL